MPMYAALQPLLMRLDPERAHALTLDLLRIAGELHLLRQPRPGAGSVQRMGLEFANRVGLAAGFDKNGACIDALGRLGFGFIEVGTVTPRPQPGNPRPRVFRLRESGAVVNRMGFPNEGVEALVERLARRSFRGICGVNIGKNAATPLEAAGDDYAACLRAVYARADYIALNISSPNTARLRELQQESRLTPLLESILELRGRLALEHGRHVPLLVKLSPDLTEQELAATARIIGSLGIEGVIATNTTVRRPGLEAQPGAAQQGGLSGRPLLDLSLAAVRRLRAELGARAVIIGVGGIDSVAAGRAMLAAGADLIQVYTGMVYRGPRLIRELARI